MKVSLLWIPGKKKSAVLLGQKESTSHLEGCMIFPSSVCGEHEHMVPDQQFCFSFFKDNSKKRISDRSMVVEQRRISIPFRIPTACDRETVSLISLRQITILPPQPRENRLPEFLHERDIAVCVSEESHDRSGSSPEKNIPVPLREKMISWLRPVLLNRRSRY